MPNFSYIFHIISRKHLLFSSKHQIVTLESQEAFNPADFDGLRYIPTQICVACCWGSCPHQANHAICVIMCIATWLESHTQMFFFKCCTEFWLGTDLICCSSVTILSWNYTCTLGTRLAADSPWAHRELAELPSAAALTDRLVNKFERHTLKYVLRSKWPWLHAEGQQQMQSNCRRVELKSDSRGCSSTIPIKLLEMPNLYSVMKTCTSWCALVAHQGQIPILLTVKSG